MSAGSRALPAHPPLTERVVAWSGRSRIAVIGAWASLPWLNLLARRALAAADILPMGGDLAGEVVDRAALSYGVALSIWAASRLQRQVAEVEPRLAKLLREADADRVVRQVFAHTGRRDVPVLLTVLSTLVFGVTLTLREGAAAAVLTTPFWLLILLPLWTFFSSYVALQISLDRLGRRPLVLQPDSGDPQMGMRPAGRLAFSSFWMFVLTLAPILVANTSDVVELGLTAAVLGFGVSVFFLSLRRLHMQMARTRAEQLAWARSLLAGVYESIRAGGSATALAERAGSLGAAETLVRRAETLHRWPFDDGTVVRVVGVATSVVAIVAARLILTPFGL